MKNAKFTNYESNQPSWQLILFSRFHSRRLFQCAVANCHQSNSMRNSRSSSFPHSCDKVESMRKTRASSKQDCRNEGGTRFRTCSTFVNVVGEERGVYLVCGVWLWHGKQPASRTDGGSSSDVMFDVWEYSCNWWWMKGCDNVVGNFQAWNRDSEENWRSMLRSCFGEQYEQSVVSLLWQKVEILKMKSEWVERFG